jgi:anthranilate phosphoribosyltransferase
MRWALERLLAREDLAEQEATELLNTLASEGADPAYCGAVLAAMRSKGEAASELRGFALGLRALARRPSIPSRFRLLDVVGTGGDGSGSLNLSTGTALLAAACGVPVAKHGNRSVSSRSGSADVLEALGYDFPLDSTAVVRRLEKTGFTFLFAPYFHPALRTLGPVRKALGVRTIFNLVGPLVNPADPPYRLIGACSETAAERIAKALSGMDVERAFVVHGESGWDEPTPAGKFLLLDVRRGEIERRVEDPSRYGLPRCTPDDLAGDDADANAAALRSVLQGSPGAHRDALLLGAGLSLLLTGREVSRKAAVRRAARALDNGDAARLLEALVGIPVERWPGTGEAHA